MFQSVISEDWFVSKSFFLGFAIFTLFLFYSQSGVSFEDDSEIFFRILDRYEVAVAFTLFYKLRRLKNQVTTQTGTTSIVHYFRRI